MISYVYRCILTVDGHFVACLHLYKLLLMDICMYIYIFMCVFIIYMCVHWYGHVLRREDSHVLRRSLDFEVEGQRKKGRPKRTWKKAG